MVAPRLLMSAAVLLATSPALAVDSVTSASRREQRAGTANAAVWIVGRGFVDGVTVTVSGDGVAPVPDRAPEVVPEAERIDGGRGDGIAFFFTIAPGATLGPRDVTVTAPDGSSATGRGILEILPGDPVEPDPMDPDPMDPDPMDPDPMDPDPMDPAPPQPPPPQQGVVTEVTRASPRAGEQGAQVNVWIAGRSFTEGLDVKFSQPGIGPASFRGEALAYGIVRNAESERGEYDGIQYYMRIAPETPVGPIDVTVTGQGGSTATGVGIFQVVAPGEEPPPLPGAGDVDEITGASPRAVRAGRNVAVWMWGAGIAEGAEVTFGAPGVELVAPSEVVEEAQNNPGYAGVRNYLKIAADAAPGPVPVTIRNPNGTQATHPGLFEIVPGSGAAPGVPGGGGGGVNNPSAVGDGGPCPDEQTSVEAVVRVVPAVLEPGTTVNVAIVGRAFACGANVIIPGGGLTPAAEPRLVHDADDPLETTLFWKLTVAADAAPGARDVTVINPNNTSKTLPAAFSVGTGSARAAAKGVAFCRAQPGSDPAGAPWLLLGLLALRRRKSR
ncbi:MAG: hypothetical protein R3F60_12870 [bacterium]